ncbi:MAG: Re/Si-specific NAD(P)(+) transhydrogenase subunit alpha [Candidatus Nealsonbacteria bacterium]|nr:Re/Si-specific NAD(P)(+) transhydrogenase subunit alpha [Candidatus Nealsonbacteria bacterium]
MIVAVTRESFPGENRVALVPALVPALVTAGLEVRVESSAGAAAGFPDEKYTDAGAKVVADRRELFAADVILQVRAAGANPRAGRADLDRFRRGQTVIGMSDPLGEPEAVRQIADCGVTLFAMEMVPRITRAQSMDVLSSMATVAGYRAVLLAAGTLPKMFPMLMTAAGTITPAKVFIMGVGVAGLQAIATARRLGAVVSANDIRPAVAEQVESLGAKFVQLELDTAAAEDKGGYAKEMGEEFLQKQRELIARVVAESDVVITTAAIPGKKAPTLVTAEMVAGMAPGAVIVDLAAERGGNCELTRPDETIVSDGVSILGPTNLPSEVPYHASQMFAKNITTFLLHLVDDGTVKLDLEDEIVRDTLMTLGGKVVNPRVCELLGIEPPADGSDEGASTEAEENTKSQGEQT